MSFRINSLTVRDFRSIRGEVTLPMNAPIILVHGKNGAGKTSLLSGMELALTGELASLDRIDSNLRKHLVNKGRDQAFVSASVCSADGGMLTGEFRVDGMGPKGHAVLDRSLARHFSERCYLAQATLGRLLEIYQPKDVAAAASPLTRFVKELLGLDALDALINGLHDAGDVRRLRGGANMYWEVRDRLPMVQKEVDRLASEVSRAKDQAKELFNSAQALFKSYWPAQAEQPVAGWRDFLAQQSYEAELKRAVQFRIEISAQADQLMRAQGIAANTGPMSNAEADASDAEEALQAWLSTVGQELSNAFQRLAAYFPDLPSPLASRPEYARVMARTAVIAETKRCELALSQDAAARLKANNAEADRKRQQDRLALLDEQISQHSEKAGQLAQALASLLPHVHSNDCPVCNRNFSEVSTTPLVGHLATNISSFTEAAGRLAALSKERSDTIAAISMRERELADEVARLLTDPSKQELERRLKDLSDLLATLEALASASIRGEALFKTASSAGQGLASLRANDQFTVSMRSVADKLAVQMAVEPIGVNESLNAAFDRFLANVVNKERELSERNSARQRAEDALREYDVRLGAIQEIESLRLALGAEINELNQRKTAGDRAIDQARELTKIAQAERTAIVRRVFNDSLNTAWKDLFVRLAPDEPFVPAFALPESTKGAVEATLETLHRDGGKGGNPRAMLSAGNLNTAALTLFLALHLSAKSRLPWLIIDDPVQSMDEVHISQFAALLRTLAKQHDRQIIIAVHEKPLFDYLTLELSPSFQSDTLITIELGRSANGDSLATTRVIPWEPDTALAA
ncbi:MAG: AAA family ATPase [Ramlibacter sp.]|nr:AAA family ATPase [Ramlibacter sp.]